MRRPPDNRRAPARQLPRDPRAGRNRHGPAGPAGPQGPQGEQGPAGEDGEVAIKTLINTSDEVAGDNCANGGVKIEVGEDTNADGILDTDEVDISLTRYVCNGADGEGGSGSGIGNFTGVDLVPEDVIYIAKGYNSTGAIETYVVPDGKYAKISSILPHTGIPEELIDPVVFLNYPNANFPFLINSEIIYPLAYRVTSGASMEQMFSSNFYFPQGTSISLENTSQSTPLGFFLEIYSLENFTPKLVISSEQVPIGKKWKVVNFLSNDFWSFI